MAYQVESKEVITCQATYLVASRVATLAYREAFLVASMVVAACHEASL